MAKKTKATDKKPAGETGKTPAEEKKLTLDDLKKMKDLKGGMMAGDQEFDYEKEGLKFSGKTGQAL